MDFELRGCPINKHQLLEVISAYLNGRKPNIPTHSVCMECKLRGTPCVMVADGHRLSGTGDAGGLRCALSGLRSRLLRLLRPHGNAEHRGAERRGGETSWAWRRPTSVRALRTYNAVREPFRKESEAYEYAHD